MEKTLNQQDLSAVEEYWLRIAKEFGDTRQWKDLNVNQQNLVINSINTLLAVLYRRV